MRAAYLLAAAILCAGIVVRRAPAQSSEAQQAAEICIVTGELTAKLDSRTAKTGDQVVIKTKSELRVTGGAKVPKGSKLMAHVTGVKPAAAGDMNAQLSVAFDQIELRDGQRIPLRAEMESVAPSDSGPNDGPQPIGAAPSNGSAGRAAGDMYGSTPSITAPTPVANQTQMSSNGSIDALDSARTNSHPGAIVARSGDLILRTTAIPGLLVANRESTPSAAPSAAQTSSILLCAGRDIVLESGTRIKIGIRSGEMPGTAGAN